MNMPMRVIMAMFLIMIVCAVPSFIGGLMLVMCMVMVVVVVIVILHST